MQKFESLIGRHARQMAAAIRRVCGRRHQSLIPDVEQEVRLAIWKRLQSGRPIEHPSSYLHKVALTTALAIVQKQAPLAAVDVADVALYEQRADAAASLLPAERRRLLDQILESVDAEEARALRAYLAGFNHTEVAELFGWSESVARHRIYRTLERLRGARQR